MVAKVLVELSNKNIDKTFDYIVPDLFSSKVKVGVRVTVPFAHQILEGFVLEIRDDSSFSDLKEIIDVVDTDIILNPELLELGKYIASITLSTLISSYQVMLPKALKAKNGVTVSKKMNVYLVLNNSNIEVTNPKQKEIIDLIQKKGKVLKKEASLISTSSVKTLLKNNILKEIQEEVYRMNHEDTVTKKYPLIPLQQEAVSKVLDKKNTDCSK